MMKALILKRYGKSNQIDFADIHQPTIKEDEMLVQVYAAGLNPIDYMIPKGTFKPILKYQLPITIGSDLSGVVIAVGNRVTRFKPGDAIFASLFDLPHGALAEYAVVPEKVAALKPASLDFVQAASIPMVGLTSWQALKEKAQLRAGQKVFIPAGSGGIGTFAIQLAKYLGATVGTTTSTRNVDLVSRLGADEIIDYKSQEFEEILQGYDLVLGTVRGDSIEKSLRILKPNSNVISLIGPPDLNFARARKMNFFMKFVFSLISRKIIRQAQKHSVDYSFLFVQPNGQQLESISALIEAKHITPVIDNVFPFEQSKDALAYLETGRAKGKVVVNMMQFNNDI